MILFGIIVIFIVSNMKFYFQHFILVCFHFLGEKSGGSRASPAPPLAMALNNFVRGYRTSECPTPKLCT